MSVSQFCLGQMAHSSMLEIEMALWYYARRGDYGAGVGDRNYDDPALVAARQRFVDAGLLRAQEPNSDVPQRFIATEGMAAYVRSLMLVPWPVQRWVTPDA